jgi:RsiW-degrading membrane proteinase PrsW (M82 family)
MKQETTSLAWKLGLLIAGIFLIYLIFMALLPQPTIEGDSLIAFGIFLALIPVLLWLAIFFILTRTVVEPKRTIWRVLILSALIASGVGLRLIEDFFGVQKWYFQHEWMRILLLISVIGFTQEFLKYFSVRYTVFPTDDFQDRGDGILFGIAAGLGYSTVLNFAYVLKNEGVLLFVGNLHMLVTALSMAAFSAVSCYFLAGAKYGKKSIWWVPAGLALAAVLNGTFSYLRYEVTVQGLSYKPVNALILATIFIVITMAILYGMMLRHERSVLSDIQKENSSRFAEKTPWEQSIKFDLPVYGLVLLTLVAGWLMKSYLLGERTSIVERSSSTEFHFPVAWVQTDEKGYLLSIRDIRADSAYKPGFLFQRISHANTDRSDQLEDFITPLSIQRGEDLTGYRMLSLQNAFIDNEEAMAIEYIFVYLPPSTTMTKSIPIVVRAKEYLYFHEGGLYSLTYIAPNDVFEDQRAIFESIHTEIDIP